MIHVGEWYYVNPNVPYLGGAVVMITHGVDIEGKYGGYPVEDIDGRSYNFVVPLAYYSHELTPLPTH